jgi:hypothetical protein
MPQMSPQIALHKEVGTTQTASVPAKVTPTGLQKHASKSTRYECNQQLNIRSLRKNNCENRALALSCLSE